MPWLKTILAAVVSLVLFASPGAGATERIIVPAQINGQPVRLALDTGASDNILFRRAAERLGLKVMDDLPIDIATPAGVKAGLSEFCRVTVGGRTSRANFIVIDLPDYLEPALDGLIGWPALRQNVLYIRQDRKEITTLKSVPDFVRDWPHWKLHTGSRLLGFEVERAEGGIGVIYIDTGMDEGVQLAPGRWRKWRESAAGEPYTLTAAFLPGTGESEAQKIYYAREIHLVDGLSVRDVPVSVTPEIFGNNPGCEAVLGLFALTRLVAVIDGEEEVIYLRPEESPVSRYQYNRLGAVFYPPDSESPHLVARVVPGGPAYESGIRDGDILTGIEDLDATKWRTDPRVLPLHRFWSRPAGTSLRLTFRRGDENFSTTVELKEIFPGPASSSPPAAESSGVPPDGHSDDREMEISPRQPPENSPP